MQRCFHIQVRHKRCDHVFSAHAEMFPALRHPSSSLQCFLCTCRDVSERAFQGRRVVLFSLHMQRCFSFEKIVVCSRAVFSAHAEMFPPLRISWVRPRRFLCTCRDVSIAEEETLRSRGFSLHMQRCFYVECRAGGCQRVFSAHAEMFPEWTELRIWSSSFLCVCRDVSGAVTAISAKRLFSLRMQRCFRRVSVDGLTTSVFSAHTGMFPGTAESAPGPVCFICISRDVSALSQPMRSVMGFSLRLQRCCLRTVNLYISVRALSMHA